jgi:multidrug efflux system membrane fusion protein
MKRFLLAAVGVIAIVAALAWWRISQKTAHEKTVKAQTAEDAIPVVTAAARIADVPVYLDGIGTVQALYTVNIHAMVDGPLIAVKFREGQDVKAGDVLAQIDPRTYQATYDQAVAKKAQDEAALQNARLDLNRYEKLAKTQYTTAQQADTQRATVAQDEALVRQDQASIESARTNLGYTTITAPIAGRTGIRQIDTGNLVHSTDTTPITVLTTLQPISVVFTLPQQDLPQVTAAMRTASPAVIALPQNGDPADILDRGHVAVLDNEIDQTTGTIKLKATFPNAGLTLWPGAFVNVRLALSTETGVTTVPTTSVQRGPAGAFVFVVKDGLAQRRSVDVPHQDDTVAVVSSGLKPGEVVVTDGTSRLTDGARVKLVTPATDPLAAPAHNG